MSHLATNDHVQLPLGPAPWGQPLTVTIECTQAPEQRVGKDHRALIQPDWQVELLDHGAESERIARSLTTGFWCSCLFAAESVIPAFRATLQTISSPRMLAERCARFAQSQEWEMGGLGCFWCDRGDDCEAGRAPQTAADAVRSAMSAEGIARLSVEWEDTDRWSVEGLGVAAKYIADSLIRAAGAAWSRWGDPRQVDDGEEGFFKLWWNGMLPHQVDEIARLLPREVWPLSSDFYWDAHFSNIDLVWLSGVISCYPTRDFAEWGVKQAKRWERIPAASVWKLVELGVSANDAIGVLDEQVPIAALRDLIDNAGVHPGTAARWLTVWARIGVAPLSEHYLLLKAHNALVPNRRLLDARYSPQVWSAPHGPSRTETAVMLALAPDSTVIVEAVRRGITTATDPRFLQLIRAESTA